MSKSEFIYYKISLSAPKSGITHLIENVLMLMKESGGGPFTGEVGGVQPVACSCLCNSLTEVAPTGSITLLTPVLL